MTEFGQDKRVLYRDIVFLCHDRVGQARSFLLRHNVFMSRQSWQWWRDFMSPQNILMSQQSVAKVKRFCVVVGKLCCDIVSQAGKISSTIEYFMSRQNWPR